MRRATYVTLSDRNSVVGPQDSRFVDTYIDVPFPLRNTAVTLVDVEGYIVPRENQDKSFYLCCDFLEDSMMQLDDDDNAKVGLFPILRRITFDQRRIVEIQNQQMNASGISESFNNLIFVPCSRHEAHTFRLYLIDGKGQLASFTNFLLKCTLLAVPEES